jgi:hypothetical protein
MNPPKKKEAVSFQLVNVKIDSISTFEPPQAFNERVEYKVDLNFDFLVDNDKNLVRLTIKAAISAVDDYQNHVFLKITTSYDYAIKGINLWVQNNKLIIPEHVAKTFISVAYGTLRGIIWGKSSQLPFQDLILPILEVDKLSKQNLTFPLKLKD